MWNHEAPITSRVWTLLFDIPTCGDTHWGVDTYVLGMRLLVAAEK
jgi:hypothetical protein